MNRVGHGARWFGPNNETTIWNINRETSQNYVHPNQKPVALAARAIKNSSQPGENVLDLFMGSGTTIITCDQMNRQAFGMEFDPIYTDVIVHRFAKYKLSQDQEFTIKLNGEDITAKIIELVNND